MSALDGLYQQLILEHSKKRAGEGPLADADAEHFERNPSCGDEITVRVKLDEAGESLSELAWQGDGCSISMASASVLSELAVGKSTTEIEELVAAFRLMLRTRDGSEPDEDLLEDAVAFQGVSKFVMRVKCAMLSWVALEASLKEAAVSRDS
ncbi:SUF system NifU family Fe-S cluster assembly protein [Pseudoclavibacter sp. AY1F1]|uniref:Fe-S cluster assembly sulfur transfer protein SufU n=1 Tax=Pseudoclavibacter sp. AY1F1 TaxID=2080583 RepID=UPI000CE8E8D1|nr:SUF system NifU family Fe-S cluster assembly protein [Pseudoclavibacter sp. AY1F1]PPF44252.1 SUF system NifU family Fe-S cluster assembly protein [Pseudoclavibacter sp. AY1F1]